MLHLFIYRSRCHSGDLWPLRSTQRLSEETPPTDSHGLCVWRVVSGGFWTRNRALETGSTTLAVQWRRQWRQMAVIRAPAHRHRLAVVVVVSKTLGIHKYIEKSRFHRESMPISSPGRAHILLSLPAHFYWAHFLCLTETPRTQPENRTNTTRFYTGKKYEQLGYKNNL